MRKLLIAIWVLLVILLSTNTLWFYYLDKKMNNVIEKQNEINSWTYQEIKSHSQDLRLLETDTDILLRIITSKEYCEVNNE